MVGDVSHYLQHLAPEVLPIITPLPPGPIASRHADPKPVVAANVLRNCPHCPLVGSISRRRHFATTADTEYLALDTLDRVSCLCCTPYSALRYGVLYRVPVPWLVILALLGGLQRLPSFSKTHLSLGASTSQAAQSRRSVTPYAPNLRLTSETSAWEN